MSGRVAVDVPLGKGTETATRPQAALCEWWAGCNDTAKVKGLCRLHYRRVWAALRYPTAKPRLSSVFGDVDEAVVLRLVGGDRATTYTMYERREAVRRLRAADMSYSEIATRLGINTRLVHRDLRALGLVASGVEQEAG